MLFVLGVGTGYRAGDLVKLRVGDVKQAVKDGYFSILEEKKANSKNIKKVNLVPREVEIVPKLTNILNNYIKGKRDYEYMFRSRKGVNRHIQVSTVSRMLGEVGKEFGLKNISAHSMRKTYALRIYRKSNEDIEAVMKLLGHSSKEITRRYLGLDKELFSQYAKSINDIID